MRPAARRPGVTTVTGRRRRGHGFIVLLTVALFQGVGIGEAQITLDGTLGPPGGLSGPSITIGDNLGQVRGNNLFHSFSEFNVNAGQAVSFTGPGSIANILNRVTGATPSRLDGFIDSRSSMPNANFFLLNPRGVIVGPGASFNVGGAVHLTTADYVGFADGARFSANPSGETTLTVADPAAFGFLGPTGSLAVQGGFLAADPGQTISLVGGNVPIMVEDVELRGVQINGAALIAPSGRIQIAGVASAGEIGLASFAVTPGTRLGAVDIVGGSLLDVSGDPHGSVVIRAGQLLVDASFMFAMNFGDVDGTPVGIDLYGQDAVTVTNFAALLSQSFGAGRGGDIRVAAGNGSAPGVVMLTEGALFLSQGLGAGRAGDILVTAIDGTNPGDVQIVNGALIASLAGGEAQAGDVVVRSGDLTLATGAQLFLSASESAQGSSVLVDVARAMTLDAGAQILSTVDGDARAGDMVINAGALTMMGAGSIASFTSGLGPSAPILLTVTGDAMLSDSGTAITSASFFEAAPGPIVGRLGSLRIQNGALVQGGLLGGTEGTSITIVATGPVAITSGGGVSSQATVGDVGPITIVASALTIDAGFISSVALNTGRAGDVVIDVGTLELTGGAQIASSTSFAATGAGGNISITATGPVTIAGASSTGLSVLPPPFDEFFTDPSSGIFSTAASLSPQAGPAGTITLSAPTVVMTDGGQLSVATLGAGSAGDIALTVDALGLGSGARIDSSTIRTGPGGSIAIEGTSLTMRDAAQISVATSGTGNAGGITLNVGTLDVAAGAQIDSGTTGPGAGGTIDITSTLVHLSDGGTISVATSGTGDGGDILLDVGTLNLTSNARIDSGTTGAGAGGFILALASNAVSLTGGAELTSSTAGAGSGGTIDIAAPWLTLADGSRISVATSGSGDAGDVALHLGTLELTTGARVDSGTTGAGAGGGIAATASNAITIATGAALTSTAAATGSGGTISLATPRLVMTDGGTMSVATSGSGRAGDIALTVGTLDLQTAARIDSGTTGAGAGGTIQATASGEMTIAGGGLASNAEATGPGGDITLTAARVFIGPGGTISARSTGSAEATAGSITINAGNVFEMQVSQVTTESLLADGGNIVIQALEMVRLTDSAITTSVQSGVGAGGNITIDPVFVILNGSEIRADAFGGPGGNILIVADVFLSAFSVISASSALSTPGTIDIQARVTDISGTLAQLPASVLQAAALLQASCATRLAEGQASSFVVAGREGLPPEPGGILPGPLLALEPGDLAPVARDGSEQEVWPIVRWAMAPPGCSR